MNKDLLKAIIQWDVRSWSRALRFWESQVDFSSISSGLELGGREGGLSLWMALNGLDVMCSDLENVEKIAKPLHVKYNVESKVQYQDIDATKIPYENKFDIIVLKSILGGIGRNDNVNMQQAVINSAYKALKPGGKLLFAENTVASPLHRFFRKHFVKWSSRWRYVSMDEMKAFLTDFSKVDLHYTGFAATFGRSEMQRNLLAIKDACFFNHVVPKSWKYICYGVAVK